MRVQEAGVRARTTPCNACSDLDLEELEVNLFRGRRRRRWSRRGAPSRVAAHAYLLRRGDPKVPIVY